MHIVHRALKCANSESTLIHWLTDWIFLLGTEYTSAVGVVVIWLRLTRQFERLHHRCHVALWCNKAKDKVAYIIIAFVIALQPTNSCWCQRRWCGTFTAKIRAWCDFKQGQPDARFPPFRCDFVVPVSRCRFRIGLHRCRCCCRCVSLPNGIEFSYVIFTEQRNFNTAEGRNGNGRTATEWWKPYMSLFRHREQWLIHRCQTINIVVSTWIFITFIRAEIFKHWPYAVRIGCGVACSVMQCIYILWPYKTNYIK